MLWQTRYRAVVFPRSCCLRLTPAPAGCRKERELEETLRKIRDLEKAMKAKEEREAKDRRIESVVGVSRPNENARPTERKSYKKLVSAATAYLSNTAKAYGVQPVRKSASLTSARAASRSAWQD